MMNGRARARTIYCAKLRCIHSDPKAYIPHIRSRVTAVHGEGSIFPYVSVIDTAPGTGRRRKRIPMDAFLGNRVTANPWEVAIAPDGSQLFVVFAGTNDMFVCNVIDDDYLRAILPQIDPARLQSPSRSSVS